MKGGNSGNNGSDLDKGNILKPTFDTLTEVGRCHTPVLKSRTEVSICVPRMFNHTHSNNMINK
jgi:hypothetical protein